MAEAHGIIHVRTDCTKDRGPEQGEAIGLLTIENAPHEITNGTPVFIDSHAKFDSQDSRWRYSMHFFGLPERTFGGGYVSPQNRQPYGRWSVSYPNWRNIFYTSVVTGGKSYSGYWGSTKFIANVTDQQHQDYELMKAVDLYHMMVDWDIILTQPIR